MNTDGFSQQDLAALLSTLRDEERRRFLYYEPYPKQREFHNNLCIQRLISGGNQRIPLDSMICTPSGFRRSGDLRIGDEVYTHTGALTRINIITESEPAPLYRVVFNDGTESLCSDDHRWLCISERGNGIIKKTIELRPHLDRIPLCSAVPYVAKDFPVPPYLLGYYLGNGWASEEKVCLSDSYDKYLSLAQYLPLGKYNVSSQSFVLLGGSKYSKYLSKLGKANDKRIPVEYQYGSIEQRKELLAGLIDSDGSIDSISRVAYYTQSFQLAKDVALLMRGLGGKVRLSSRSRTIKLNGNTYNSTEYCVRGRTPFKPNKLPSKNEWVYRDNRDYKTKSIVSVTLIGEEVQRCYGVEHEDHTYLINDYIVTHNTGKSFCTIMETCFHCTGLYPDWWKGHRPPPRINTVTKQKELRIWYLGTDNQTVRNSLQSRIIGTEENNYTDGAIHVDYINLDSKMMKRNVSAAVDKIRIRHVGGFEVELCFKSYEQGRKNLQSEPVDIVVFDEEPPADVYAECVARLAATDGFYYMAFTPLLGMTPLVHSFWMRNDPNKSLTTLSVYDSPHFTQKMLDNLEARYSGLSPSEKRARMLGLPAIGAGMVYPIEDESLIDPSFPTTIPNNWKQIGAIDFGRGEHPFAAVWVAIDPLTGVHYLYDCIKVTQKPEEEIAELLKRNGDWIPFAYPHDLMRNSGISSFKGLKKTEGWLYKNIFEELGLTMTPTNAMLPEGGIAVEPGIVYVRNLMHKGLLKVHPKLEDWWEEKRLYAYGDDSRPKKVNDDLMDAMRYALIMTRFAASKREMVLQALVGSAEPKNETPVFHHAK